jgi:hypothetical protein
MIVEVRKHVFVNPDHVVAVFFDPAAGKLVMQMVVGHHTFNLVEGEMPETALARVAELLNKPARTRARVVNNTTVTGDPKAVVELVQPKYSIPQSQ